MCVQGESNPPDQVQKLSVDDGEFLENILHCGSILSFYFLMLGATLTEDILEFAGHSAKCGALGGRAQMLVTFTHAYRWL